jgi:hypothetical protein
MSQGDEQDVVVTGELSEVAAGIVRAFEEATAGGGDAVPEVPPDEDHPDAVRLIDEAFGRAEAALGTNVLPFRVKPAQD